MGQDLSNQGEEPLFGGFAPSGEPRLKEKAPAEPKPLEEEEDVPVEETGPALSKGGSDDDGDIDEDEFEVLPDLDAFPEMPLSIPAGDYRIKRGSQITALRPGDDGGSWLAVASVRLNSQAEALHDRAMVMPVTGAQCEDRLTVVEVDGLAFLVPVDRLIPGGSD